MEDDLKGRIQRLKARTREVKKRMGRPVERDPFDPSQRRKAQHAYQRTTFNIPLWAVAVLLEAEARGLGGPDAKGNFICNRSSIVAAALQLYADHHGIGVLVPVGQPLPGKPGEQARRLYMPRPGQKKKGRS